MQTDSERADAETDGEYLTLFTLAYLAERRRRRVEGPTRFGAVSELGPPDIQQLREVLTDSSFHSARAILSRAKQGAVTPIPVLSATYPPLLRTIPGPPDLLYVRGDLKRALGAVAIAIVGSRAPSRESREFAEKLAYEVSCSGAAVISGLAYGCDAAAHRGALRACREGRAISPGVAVLGSGVLNVYPADHRELADEIVRAGGAVVSEAGLDTAPLKGFFPARNRIISGLALATVVIEAGEKSGSLITARVAAEQGREVFAVPGGVFSPRAFGTNQLLKDGARPLTTLSDLTEFLPRPTAPDLCSNDVNKSVSEVVRILRREGALSFDDLLGVLSTPPEKLLAEISRLEIEGSIECSGGLIAVRR